MTSSTAVRNPDLDHKFTGVHSLTIKVTEQNLWYQVCAAIEGGSNDWAEIDVHKHAPGWANYFTATFKVIEESSEAQGAIHGNRSRTRVGRS